VLRGLRNARKSLTYKGIAEWLAIMLTTALDNILGSTGNDTIIGSVSKDNAALNTLSAMDTINGGAGIDTLKIFDETGADILLPGLSNVEIIEVSGVSAEGVSIDTSANADVTNLNVVKAAGDVTAVAADSTDVSVAGVVSAKLVPSLSTAARTSP